MVIPSLVLGLIVGVSAAIYAVWPPQDAILLGAVTAITGWLWATRSRPSDKPDTSS